MAKSAILVVDDDEAITSTISTYLRAKGYSVRTIHDGGEALQAVRTGRYPIVITDIYIDRVSGLEILMEAKSCKPEPAVVLMTARGSVRTTVEAEMGGAFDYLAKPFELRDLLSVVERAERARVPAAPEEKPAGLEVFGELVGSSPPMVEVYKKIARSAKSDETVLIVGETGVGKELVARAIHENSPRARKPFIPVDSGAVTGTLWESEIFGALRGSFTGAERDRTGVVESARGGTIFFDEIGEIPLDFQPKLLRFLQEKEFRPVGAGAPRKADVRIMAATNRSLEQMVAEGVFREDLFYRLNVLRIDVPALRERVSDIRLLLQRFLHQKPVWLEPDAVALLERYSWPGNVRELQNTILRLAALNPRGPISAAEVEPVLRTAQPAEPESKTLEELERRQILRVLQETGGNKTKAAEILGIQRRTLYKKMARLKREE